MEREFAEKNERHNREQEELLLAEINFIKREKEMIQKREEEEIMDLQQKLE